MSVESLAKALLEAGILDSTSVEVRVPRARTGRQLLEGIVADGLSTESSLVNQLARSLSVPRYDPKERQPEPEALGLLEMRDAQELGVLPVALRGGGALLWVAVCDPTDENSLAEVARRTGRRVKPCLIGPRELTRAFQQAPPTPQAPAAPQAYAMAPGGQTGQFPIPSMPMGMPGGLPYAQMPTMLNGPMASGMNPYGAYPTPYGGFPLPMGGGVAAQNGPGPLPGVPAGAVGMNASRPQAAPTQPSAANGRTTELQKLEDELAQARQVVKVLAQLLVERGLIDGEELKRRLRAERERK